MVREGVHTILGLSVLDTGSGINAGIPIEGDVVDCEVYGNRVEEGT